MVWSADEHTETASEKQGARPVNFCCGWCLWWWRWWWCWWSLLKRWGTNYYASVLSDDAALMHTMHTHWAREMTTLKRWPCHQRKKKKGKERRKEEKVKCRLTAELSIMSSARSHWMSVLSLRLSLSMSLTTMGTTSTSTVHFIFPPFCCIHLTAAPLVCPPKCALPLLVWFTMCVCFQRWRSPEWALPPLLPPLALFA